MKWAIFYDWREEPFTSDDGEPWEAPRYGVQEVFMEDEHLGARVETSRVGYWLWRHGEWSGCDDHMGFWDYMFHYQGTPICLFGRTLQDLEWEKRVADRSRKTGNLKSAWRRRERRDHRE